jgi:hypothetical protein
MNNILSTFYNNESQRETVRTFMIEVLKELAVEKTFDGKETKGIKDARECVEKMFDKLEELYGIIKKPLITNSR